MEIIPEKPPIITLEQIEEEENPEQSQPIKPSKITFHSPSKKKIPKYNNNDKRMTLQIPKLQFSSRTPVAKQQSTVLSISPQKSPRQNRQTISQIEKIKPPPKSSNILKIPQFQYNNTLKSPDFSSGKKSVMKSDRGQNDQDLKGRVSMANLLTPNSSISDNKSFFSNNGDNNDQFQEISQQSINALKENNLQKGLNLLRRKFNFQNPDDQNLLVQIMQSEEKSQLEIKYILKAIKKIEFFKKHESQIQSTINEEVNLINQLELQHVKKYQPLFLQGDLGFHYYILVKGSAMIIKQRGNDTQDKKQEKKKKKELLELEKERDLEEDETPEEKKQKILNMHKTVQIPPDLKLLQNDINFLEDTYPNTELLMIAVPGNSFGEIALVKNSERMASVIAKEDSYFLGLNKQAYFEIFGEIHAEKMNNQLEFLNNFYFFKQLPERYVISVVYDLLYKKIPRNTYLYKKDEKVENIYFIKSGTIEIQKNVKAQNNALKSVTGLKGNSFEQFLISHNSKNVPMYQVTQGQVLGEDEILMEQDTRQTSACCYSQEVEVYYLSKQIFLNMIKKQKYTFRQFLKDCKLKSQYFKDQMEHQEEIIEKNIKKPTPLLLKEQLKYIQQNKNSDRQKNQSGQKKKISNNENCKTQASQDDIQPEQLQLNKSQENIPNNQVKKTKKKPDFNILTKKLHEYQNNTGKCKLENIMSQVEGKEKILQNRKNKMLQKQTSIKLQNQNSNQSQTQLQPLQFQHSDSLESFQNQQILIEKQKFFTMGNLEANKVCSSGKFKEAEYKSILNQTLDINQKDERQFLGKYYNSEKNIKLRGDEQNSYNNKNISSFSNLSPQKIHTGKILSLNNKNKESENLSLKQFCRQTQNSFINNINKSNLNETNHTKSQLGPEDPSFNIQSLPTLHTSTSFNKQEYQKDITEKLLGTSNDLYSVRSQDNVHKNIQETLLKKYRLTKSHKSLIHLKSLEKSRLTHEKLQVETSIISNDNNYHSNQSILSDQNIKPTHFLFQVQSTREPKRHLTEHSPGQYSNIKKIDIDSSPSMDVMDDYRYMSTAKKSQFNTSQNQISNQSTSNKQNPSKFLKTFNTCFNNKGGSKQKQQIIHSEKSLGGEKSLYYKIQEKQKIQNVQMNQSSSNNNNRQEKQIFIRKNKKCKTNNPDYYKQKYNKTQYDFQDQIDNQVQRQNLDMITNQKKYYQIRMSGALKTEPNCD